MVDEESGLMQIQFSIFLKTSNFLMLMLGLFVSLCIYYLPLLAIVGTLELFAILLFITSFITLGFNIHNVSQIINEEKEEEEEGINPLNHINTMNLNLNVDMTETSELEYEIHMPLFITNFIRFLLLDFFLPGHLNPVHKNEPLHY